MYRTVLPHLLLYLGFLCLFSELARTQDECYTVTVPCSEDQFPNQPLRDPDPGRRLCFRAFLLPNNTCVAEERINQPLRTSIFSPRFNDDAGRPYQNNRICKYLAECTGGALNIIFTGNDIEPKQPCPGFEEPQCVDRLFVDVYGGITTCGVSDPMIDFQRLSLQQLFVSFQTNMNSRLCGFNMNIQCVPFTTYDTEGCVFPPGDNRGRRSIGTNPFDQPVMPDPAFKIRERRSFRNPNIFVSDRAYVTYSDSMVRVVSEDGRWLYKFAGIQVFQVFNRMESYQTFRRDGPSGRRFPGIGWLMVGYGIVMFLQEGVPSQLRPSVMEEEVIFRLQNAVNLVTDDDFEVPDDPAIPGVQSAGRRSIKRAISKRQAGLCMNEALLPSEEQANMADAEFYATACTGPLRMVACRYQAQFRGNLTEGCQDLEALMGVPIMG